MSRNMAATNQIIEDFELVVSGLNGDIDLIPATEESKKHAHIPRNTLAVGVPPVLPGPKEDLEEFLLHPENLPVYDLSSSQRFWPREADVSSLYSIDVTPLQTTVVVDRNPTTGELMGFKEELLPDTSSDAKNSTSLHRQAGPPEQSIRGSSTNYPFWPGGLDEPIIEKLKPSDIATAIDLENDLCTVPPGFAEGMEFPKKSMKALLKRSEVADTNVLNLQDILAAADEIDFGDEEVEKKKEEKPLDDSDKMPREDTQDEDVEVDSIIEIGQKRADVIELKEPTQEEKKYEYAVYIDCTVPVDDFYKRVPVMAYQWPFELDAFQKQAVLCLENHQNVFVAAHTSAGKTVVAEYAIALSMKHMTRTIYTSPIKALSNQKFRDFKTTFEDVGLVTGDVQINQEASCLIMTTEILRSMLYKGSDVIRDLEWVIFDEVHYINDKERGVVWEEVLIMLPQHVNIILLSATVPNKMEFADWVGKTKRKNVYVVGTSKRPVPLEHYLYTGNSAKTSNELFKIVDTSKNFLLPGYNKADLAKKERMKKSTQNFGPKGPRGGDPRQEKNIWLSVIEMLRKKDKLPVVAFTFSRKRIDENAINMKSVDLTTEREKGKITGFIQRCVSRLKGSDRKLPQVSQMSEMLKRGIGVHHSGILPILKEVVEMLFCQGFVKVLFATETFAMGVNMPARTVVFDSTRKHDGTEFRNLLPGEYIQMAGRAGRRGLDTTGTVIIMVKGDAPPRSELETMMLGIPTKLESRFRLTYTMILNLLRVQQLRVEDMMKRSFCEFHKQRDIAKQQHMLSVIGQRMQDMPQVVDYSGDLEAYYHACDNYYTLKAQLQETVQSHPQAIKALSAGRVVVIDTKKHPNSLAVIVQASMPSSRKRLYTVLILCDLEPVTSDDGWVEESMNAEAEEWSLPRPVTSSQLFLPQGPCGHEVIEVSIRDIATITTTSLKVNASLIVDDYKKRQIPRFKDDPPGQSVLMATQELLRLAESNPEGLPALDPIKDLHLRSLDLVEKFTKLKSLEQSFGNYKCVHDPCFQDNFERMKRLVKMQDAYNQCQYELSDASLKLIPDYEEKIQVLTKLNYIDKNKIVQLKGRVACEISNHELITTELVFQNILTSLQPTEIASLLSCLVFQQRRCSAPNLTPGLLKAKETFLEVATQLGLHEDDFYFGLMEVTYEWARGMPFAEITDLTDVQEGVVVRCIQRLDEVLKDVRNAAMVIGDPVLKSKMEESSSLIKRDIVFAASLYTQ